MDNQTLRLIERNPILVECERCHWAGDIREAEQTFTAYLDGSGELDYEKEAVCPNCKSPFF